MRTLCGFHQRHGDLPASRKLLEQLVSFTPLDAANQVMLAETLWQLGEREAALERACRVAGFEPGYQHVWTCLNEWTQAMKCRDVARDSPHTYRTARRRGALWLVLARAYNLPEELDSRLAALDKALELNPECVDAFDLRARSLAAARRWDEAFEACRPKVFGDHVPLELRARGAWIAAEQGDRKRAIREMRQVVAESPAIFDAWASLHQWSNEADDAQGSLEAAEAMVRISPQYEYSHGCLGQARKMCKNREGAIEAFRLRPGDQPGL